MSALVKDVRHAVKTKQPSQMDAAAAQLEALLDQLGVRADPADASYLPLLLRLTPSSMKTIALSGQERSRLLALIIEYYRLHVADFPELKSLDVLHEVFSQ